MHAKTAGTMVGLVLSPDHWDSLINLQIAIDDLRSGLTGLAPASERQLTIMANLQLAADEIRIAISDLGALMEAAGTTTRLNVDRIRQLAADEDSIPPMTSRQGSTIAGLLAGVA